MTNHLMDIQGIADHAAAQSDRWLFVATLVAGIGGIGFLWRWLTIDRDKVSARLEAITDRHIEQGEKLSEVVANNTAALNQVKEVVATCRYRQNNTP